MTDRYIARFSPEVWIRDNATTIEEPTTEYEVTDFLDAEQQTLLDEATGEELTAFELNAQETLFSRAPENCQAHGKIHPFTIYVRRLDEDEESTDPAEIYTGPTYPEYGD